ncbi:MAG: hypothetical protein ABI488_25595 [Polyangiaceae bacterium]
MTNFIGNAVATIVVSRWANQLPRARAMFGVRSKGVAAAAIPLGESDRVRVSDGVMSQGVPEFAGEMSTSWTPRTVSGVLLLAALAGSTGCGASGLDWVAESEVPARPSEPVDPNPAVRSGQAAALIPAGPEHEPEADARPRLSHTVTLGETDVPSPSAPAASGPAGVSVTINNYTNVAAPGGGYGYVSNGYGRGASAFIGSGGAARSSTSGPQAGQNWPGIADHGSSFPYRSAPASPWARAQ